MFLVNYPLWWWFKLLDFSFGTTSVESQNWNWPHSTLCHQCCTVMHTLTHTKVRFTERHRLRGPLKSESWNHLELAGAGSSAHSLNAYMLKVTQPFQYWGYFHPKSTRKQRSLKTIYTLSYWYSLDSSHWVLSHEYPFTRVSVIFRYFASFCIGQISHQGRKGYVCGLVKLISKNGSFNPISHGNWYSIGRLYC